MDLVGMLATFVVAVVLISASPGPAMALVLRRAAPRGWRAAWRARKLHDGADEVTDDAPAGGGPRRWWWTFGEGTMVQLANPKAAAFMIAFYPQFVPAGRPLFTTTAGLALLQVIIETALYLALAGWVGRARSWFARPAVRRRWDMISGSVLIALGVRVAATSR